MNNEKYNQILDAAYKNYEKWFWDNCQPTQDITSKLTKEQFINNIKTYDEFAKEWGLKIEERELSFDERSGLAPAGVFSLTQFTVSNLDELKVPTKLITLTYNETIEVYE